MIVDLRIYTYKPNAFRRFLAGYEKEGFALTSKHLGKTLGIFTSDSGVMNRTFQFFAYESEDHRDTCRRGMLSDPAWFEFIRKDADAIREQTSRLLDPLPGSPFGGSAPGAPIPDAAQPGAKRLFEMTVYETKPDRTDAAAALLNDRGIAAMNGAGHGVVGAFRIFNGDEDRLLTLSVHASVAARHAAQARLRDSDDGKAFLGDFAPMLRGRTSDYLNAPDYSPMR